MELNYIEHFEILDKLENRILSKLIKKYNITNNSTIKLELNNSKYAIIHRSSKKANKIQISYFDKAGAYADKEVNDIKEALKQFNTYKLKIKEVF